MKKSDYLAKIKDIHPINSYCYSLVPEKITLDDKITLKCFSHGLFQQQASLHLGGSGCTKCYHDRRRSNLDEFVRKALLKHDGRYTYGKVLYKQSRIKVEITCPEHGGFMQTPYDHLKGSGCPICYQTRNRGNTKDFIEKAKRVHGDLYDYSKVSYTLNHVKVTIGCKIHGDFEQQPATHLNGHGCRKCFESLGEKNLATFLDDKGITYVREFRFADSSYRYDFFLPDQNILIEFHGRQHYEPVDYWGGEEGFEKQQQRDLEKELLAVEKGVDLIVLNYHHLNSKVLEVALVKSLTRLYKHWIRFNGEIHHFKTTREACAYFKIKSTSIPSAMANLLKENYLNAVNLF